MFGNKKLSSLLAAFLLLLLVGASDVMGMGGDPKQQLQGEERTAVRGAKAEIYESETSTFVEGAKMSIRRLQEEIIYNFDNQGIYTFPMGTEITFNPSEVRDVIRLTQIFYRRIMGQLFSQSYVDATCEQTTVGEEGEIVDSGGAIPAVRLNFTTTLTFRLVGDVPNPTEALAATQNFDQTDYLVNFVRFAFPSSSFCQVSTCTVLYGSNHFGDTIQTIHSSNFFILQCH